MDSGIATISTACTSSTSGSSRLQRRAARHVIGPALPNRMAPIPTLPRPPSSACFEGVEQWQQQHSDRVGRSRAALSGESGRPHSRYLRRAHSSDRSSSSVIPAQGMGQAELERCHSEEMLTGLERRAFPMSSSYKDTPQPFAEHGRLPSVPVKQTAR